MLKAASEGAAVVVCNTCRLSADALADDRGRRGGALLVEALRAVQVERPDLANVAVEEMPCLFACAEACTIHLRAPGKIGYVLGRFVPDREAAEAILDYASHYAASAEGQVPYRDWPAGVKGHFIVRTPPAGFVVE